MMRAWWLLGCVLLAVSGCAQTPLKPTHAGLVYGTADNVPLTMDYYAGAGVGARPIALLVHGGSGSEEFGADLLAPAGYDVFSIKYQAGQQHPVEDVERAIRYVRFHAREWNGDARKIALIGESAGGYLSTMVGLRNSSGVMGSDDAVERESARVQAVVALFGSGGSSAIDGKLHAMLSPLLAEKGQEAALAQSSPDYVDPQAPPFLLVSGAQDPSTSELQEELRKVGLRCDVVRASDWKHNLTDWLSKTLAQDPMK